MPFATLAVALSISLSISLLLIATVALSTYLYVVVVGRALSVQHITFAHSLNQTPHEFPLQIRQAQGVRRPLLHQAECSIFRKNRHSTQPKSNNVGRCCFPFLNRYISKILRKIYISIDVEDRHSSQNKWVLKLYYWRCCCIRFHSWFMIHKNVFFFPKRTSSRVQLSSYCYSHSRKATAKCARVLFSLLFLLLIVIILSMHSIISCTESSLPRWTK